MSNTYKNIQNPFIVSNILTLPTEGDSIEIDYDTEKKEITVKTIKPKTKKKKED
jgi:hypothetical protein